MDNKAQYNRAKTWQMALFPLNNLAINVFIMLMNFVSYLAVGGYGLLVVAASTIMTSMRIFDAVTDPICGFIMDRMNTRFGKYRPIMVLGYGTISLALLIMFFWGINGGLPAFIASYALYILGYTMLNAITRPAQTCITNDPAQRPMFSRFDASYITIFGVCVSLYVSRYLTPKFGGFTTEALQEFCITAIGIAGVCVALAIVALWSKDVPENFGIAGASNKTTFKDYARVLKGNRPMQMLVVAASTDKLASTAAANSAVTMAIFGIIVGNYGFYGSLSLYSLIPTLLVIFVGTRLALKQGSKKALVQYSWLSIIFGLAIWALFFFGDPTQIGTAVLPTALFLVIYFLYNGSKMLSSSIVTPMIADCSDYELYRTGQYVPGLMGGLYTFVDKMISSLAATIIGLMFASIGYTEALPTIGDASTPQIFWVALGAWLGLPILGWAASLIAMKFYELDGPRMKEIQDYIAEQRQKGAEKASGT